jgi:uncharacterized membrane protein YdbT with pleckstrin-like domain
MLDSWYTKDMDQQPVPPTPSEQSQNPPRPVAYDSEGRPLYAAPPAQTTPQVVHLSRAVEPINQPVPPGVQARHEQAVHDHPYLNLSEGEFIISAVRRHPIGLFLPVGITIFLVALTASLMINFSLITQSLGLIEPPGSGAIFLVGSLLILLFLIGGYVAVWVYTNNKFFLTNESVIQEIQTSLFSRHEQTVSLSNIEDASFLQHGILQSIFDYGSIRLSTEGDETTYRFSYVSSPKRQIALLNNAVEAFKNGRPVIND